MYKYYKISKEKWGLKQAERYKINETFSKFDKEDFYDIIKKSEKYTKSSINSVRGVFMKYGLMYFKDTDNIGDDIQTYVAKRFLPHIDYYIDREKLNCFIPNETI